METVAVESIPITLGREEDAVVGSHRDHAERDGVWVIAGGGDYRGSGVSAARRGGLPGAR
jgi:hypothetical protein